MNKNYKKQLMIKIQSDMQAMRLGTVMEKPGK